MDVLLNVLYFQQPLLFGRSFGGVTNVAYNLPMALAKRIRVTYFPSFIPRRSYAVRRLNVFRSLAVKDFDIVHFNVTPSWTSGGYMLFRYAKINGASTILNIHGIIQVEHMLDDLRTRWFWLTSYKGLSSTLRYCKIADRIVTYSEFMRTNIVTWYGVNRDKIAVIPNRVDVRKFSECDSELFLEGDPAILYLGSLSSFKSPDLLIHAIAKLRSELPNMKLHLVGSGDKTPLELLAKKKDVERQVVFHGYAGPATVPRYYKSADFCIFPSRRDSAGITLLEAMASGTPVIASNRGGTPEIISSGENGILFAPEDTDALPKAILALSQDSDLRKRISHNALKTVTKYSWENVAEKYVSLYKCLREARTRTVQTTDRVTD
jgi:glycosyltransferase involved in cell wall biosynthesis